MLFAKLFEHFMRHDRDVAICVELESARLAEAGSHPSVVEVADKAPLPNGHIRLRGLWNAAYYARAHCNNCTLQGCTPFVLMVFSHCTYIWLEMQIILRSVTVGHI